MQLRNILRAALPIPIIIAIVLFISGPSADAATDETTYYLLTDHLGSIDVVLDESGQVVERRDFLPYGKTRTPLSGAETRQFTGKELDAETGLYCYGVRKNHIEDWLNNSFNS